MSLLTQPRCQREPSRIRSMTRACRSRSAVPTWGVGTSRSTHAKNSLARLHMEWALQQSVDSMMHRACSLSLLALVACRDATASKQRRSQPRSPAPPSPLPVGELAPASRLAGSAAEARSKRRGLRARRVQGGHVALEGHRRLRRRQTDRLSRRSASCRSRSSRRGSRTRSPPNKPPGCPTRCPGWKWAQQRFYKFTDYLKALGVDLHKVKEIHVYGPKLSQTIVVDRRRICCRQAADEFMFRFGGRRRRQADPARAAELRQRQAARQDQRRDDLHRQEAADDHARRHRARRRPIRSACRTTASRCAAACASISTTSSPRSSSARSSTRRRRRRRADGELALELRRRSSQRNGVDTSKVVEGWVIRDERRTEKIPWAELVEDDVLRELAGQGRRAARRQEARARTRSRCTRARIKPDELPVIQPDEECSPRPGGGSPHAGHDARRSREVRSGPGRADRGRPYHPGRTPGTAYPPVRTCHVPRTADRSSASSIGSCRLRWTVRR